MYLKVFEYIWMYLSVFIVYLNVFIMYLNVFIICTYSIYFDVFQCVYNIFNVFQCIYKIF
jgi:hypothetical protein